MPVVASKKYLGRNLKRKAFAVTPSDTDELPFVVSELYVGGTGAVSVVFDKDTDPTVIPAVPVGRFIKGNIKQVRSTGTTATNLIAII